MTLTDDIARLLDEIPPRDAEEEACIQERWLRMSRPGAAEPDYLPLVVSGFDRNRPGERKTLMEHDRFPMEEQFEDPQKMLYEELVGLPPLRRYPGDGATIVMPKFGNAFLLSALGLEVRILDGKLEPARSLTREEARRLELPADIAQAGLIARAVRFIRYARSALPAHIPVGLCFMMSPYDLAYLIRGGELMIDMYEAPDDVHRLMAVCADLFVRATLLLKREAGEPAGFHRYFHSIHAGGGLLCEDCCVMLSAGLHREFSIPYTRQALDAIGGGWLHFCGDGRHITDNYLQIPNLYGIQYGQLELNGPVAETVRKHTAAGKALNCPLPRHEGETWADYFRRIVDRLRRRKYLCAQAGAFTDEETGGSLLDLWHEAQDCALPKAAESQSSESQSPMVKR